MGLNNCLKRFMALYKIPKVKLDYPDNFDEFYPEITDSMYIKLLALSVKYWRRSYVLVGCTPEMLKAEILSDCCYMIDGLVRSPEKNKIIKEVRKIIQGGE